MSNASSYLGYLPEILGSTAHDPSGFFGRTLRVFERILTGLPVPGEVLRLSAPIDAAAGATVNLTDGSATPRFRPGDVVTVFNASASNQPRQVTAVAGTVLTLDAPLDDDYGPDASVRLADLAVGTTRFRVTDTTGLGAPGATRLTQGDRHETVTISALDGDAVVIGEGLTLAYPLDADAMPIGLSDVTTLETRGRRYRDFEATLDRLHESFDPWRAPADFLPYLASWLALELEPEWSEHQRRRIISTIGGIYRNRGLTSAIHDFLEIFALSEARPRITIDDGEAVLRARFAADGSASLHPLGYAGAVTASGQTQTVLLHPTGIACTADNDYLVVDVGVPDQSDPAPQPPVLWRLSATGAPPFAVPNGGTQPMPQPVHSGPPLIQPTGVAVRSVNGVDEIYVCDAGISINPFAPDSSLVRFDPAPAVILDRNTSPAFGAPFPVDLLFAESGSLLVLDRGIQTAGTPPIAVNSDPAVVVVELGPPITVDRHPLDDQAGGPQVAEPTAFVEDSQGRLIVADARQQKNSVLANLVPEPPADLILVDPADNWSRTSLLSGVPPENNPLLYPTGLVFETPDRLLVCDTGLRLGSISDESGADRQYREAAEQPALYRVDLAQTPPTITRVTDDHRLVSPSKMMLDRRGRTVIADAGERYRFASRRNWRLHHNEHGVGVYFSAARPIARQARVLTRFRIARLVDREASGHASTWMHL